MTTNTNPDGNVPLTTTGDVSLATFIALVSNDVVRAGSKTVLEDRFAPTEGRAGITADDTVYIGDGSAWQSAAAFLALFGNRSWRRLAPVTANTTLSDQGVIQPADTSGGVVTVTLASAMVEDGAEVIVKDEAGDAGTNAITVATEGGETIDGAASQDIASNYGVLRLYSDGTNWYTR
jgi:hypothetical protein